MDQGTLDQLVEAVHRYTRERLVPIEERVADRDEIPREIVGEMRELGLFGLSTPEAYGGLGLGAADEIEVMLELGWASAVFRSLVGINLGLGSQALLMDGTAAQRDEWLPSIASGETIVSFCLTEPDAGSDAASLTTSAVRDGDVYRLNGTKRYISNAPRAGLFVVMARTSREALPKNAHVSAFLVPAGTPGLSIGARDRRMGQSGGWSADVIFEDVVVPADAIIGGVEGRGFATAMKSLDRGRLGIATVCVAQTRRLLYEATRYAAERRQFGRPIGEFQLIQAMLADSQADLIAAEAMIRAVARRVDAGESVSMEAAACKMFCSEVVGRVADRAVQIHGGAGYMRDSVVERLYRDARVFRIYEGTTQILQTVIGRELMRRAAA